MDGGARTVVRSGGLSAEPTGGRAVAVARRLRTLYSLLGATESAWTPFSALFLSARGFSAGEIGGVLAAMALAGFLSGPGWGLAADRWLGHRRTLTLIAGGAAPLALLCFLAPGKPAVAVSCIALWAWKAPQSGIADAIALTWLRERRGRYGSVRLWLSFGFAVFAVVWGALFQVCGARYVPLVYAAMLAIVAVSSTGLTRLGPVVPVPPSPSAIGSPRRRSLLTLAAFLVSLFLLQAAYFAAENFFALRIVQLGGGALLVGVGNALQAGVEVPVMAWMSRRSNRLRSIDQFAVGCVIWMAVFGGWALASNAAVATVINLLAGVGFAFTAVATVVIVDELVPLRFRATGQTAARAVGGGLAPVAGLVAGGALYGAVGPGAMFAATAALAGLAAVAATVALLRTSA